jgi:hypothetical protein
LHSLESLWISNLLNWIDHAESRELENYLARSANLADLERRMREWETGKKEPAGREVDRRLTLADTVNWFEAGRQSGHRLVGARPFLHYIPRWRPALRILIVQPPCLRR